MSAPVDVLAVLGRHVALAEQVGCREQRAEAHAVFDAVSELIEASTQDLWSHDKVTRIAARRRWDAALRAVGGNDGR